MGIYLVKTNKSYYKYNLSGGPAPIILAMAINVAKGEDLNLDYLSYVKKEFIISSPELDSIRKSPWDIPYPISSGRGPLLVIGGITYVLNSLNVPVIQIFQGIIDSVGCLLVYGILRIYYSRRISLLGSLLYAICPIFIFYSYHFLAEAYIPVFMLGIGYMVILGLERDKWWFFGLAGILIGLSFGFRLDNFLILPFYLIFILWFYRDRLLVGLGRSMIILLCCITAYLPLRIGSTASSVGVPLYASLGEYPGNFKGLRFGSSAKAREHGITKVKEYLREDELFRKMYSIGHWFFPSLIRSDKETDLITLAFVREVIIEEPLLYANRIITRLVSYLPAHPFIACIGYFLSNKNLTTYGYQYSSLFHGLKYIDYLFFLVFVYGVWLCRSQTELLSFLCIYLGVHISHVILGCGDIHYIRDEEYFLLNPRYLIGMMSIWPVFLAVGGAEILKKIRESAVVKKAG
jgi:hypothetical protein